MKKGICTILLLSLLIGLTACGASTGSATMTYKAEAPAMEAAAEDAAVLAGSGGDTSATVPEGRKWVVTMYINAETEDLDAMTQELDGCIATAGGYLETKNVFHGSSRDQYRSRTADLILRIPADQADAFVQDVGAFSNIVSQEKILEDITLTYVATESRMNALRTEEARLLELLAQAENMEDLLAIEARLSQVRTELEAVTTQMRIYDNQVDYATIHLYIREVREYTPVEEPSLWQRITRGFTGSLEGLAEDAVNLFVWIIAYSPYLVVYGGLAAVGIVLLRKLPRKKKKAPKEDA